MEKQLHPLDSMRDQINEHGLMLLEGVNRVLTYEKPYVSPFYVFCLNQQGWLKSSYDMKPVEFHPHDFTLIPPGHIIMAKESSEDYLVSFLAISPQFLEKLGHQHPFFNGNVEFHYNVALHLTNVQYEGVLGYFQMLSAINHIDHPNREELLAHQLEIGIQVLEIYLKENGMVQKSTPVQNLVNQFKNAIVKHCTENRTVQYYANLLCLSPKYFGSIIKEQTGITAGDMISRYVILKAKFLLRNSRNLNIQQISYQLGFPDPAAFTRYFKANAGMSPKEYRAQLG